MNASSERSSATQIDTTDREIKATRIFDAPRELVFDVWTDPKHIAQWWGPNGFRNTIHSMDVRPGGVWEFIMHGPDGTDYKNKIIYQVVDRPSRIVYKHVTGPVFEATVDFEDLGGKTKLTMCSVFESAELRNRVAKEFGAVEGMHQTLGRLDQHVAMLRANQSGEEFVISREFDVSRDLLFKAWTEPERLAQWWGPKGFSMFSAKVDLTPGGIFHYGMRSPDGHEMWGKFIYREIVPPEKLVFIDSFSDENQGVTRHPLSATWPLEMLNTVTLTENDGKTILTLRAIAYAATEEERATFKAGRSSMQQGFGGTMDQLADYLARA